MTKISDREPKRKHILLLYEGDFEKIGSFFPDLGPTVAIRRLVRETIKKLEQRVAQQGAMKGELDV